MIILKAIVIMTAVVIAIFAALFGIASGVSMASKDMGEQRDAICTSFWSLVVFALCAAIILSLSGCQAVRVISDTCRDGLCR